MPSSEFMNISNDEGTVRDELCMDDSSEGFYNEVDELMDGLDLEE
ncbi:hypothetical protein EWM64_g10485 [Hericium alpestre]|uniref:Uncharacterized protein n=1 Tax=Hericium alpestre TaxID=135208 RepID=A0A4Y9ZHN5_9AGAM|nr:hypothetical protein EWM64_g10485 [Hericium alpestre]